MNLFYHRKLYENLNLQSFLHTLVEFQNSAHLSWIQEPQAYTKAIIDFLDGELSS